MHNKAIRLENMRRLIKEAGSIKNLADRTAERDPDGKGVPASHISNLHNRTKVKGKPREIGDKTARKFERGMNKPDGWLDAIHEGVADSPLLTGVADPCDLTSVLAPRRRSYSAAAKDLTPEQMEDIVTGLHEAIDEVLKKMDGYKKSNEVQQKITGVTKTTTVSAARAKDKLGLPPKDGVQQKPPRSELPFETPERDDRTGDLFGDL